MVRSLDLINSPTWPYKKPLGDVALIWKLAEQRVKLKLNRAST
jgi:hypothetical protein